MDAPAVSPIPTATAMLAMTSSTVIGSPVTSAAAMRVDEMKRLTPHPAWWLRVPHKESVAYLSSKDGKGWDLPYGKNVQTAAQAPGLTLVLAEHTSHDYADATTLINRARAEALFVSPSPAAYGDRALIVDFATRTRLPSTFSSREPVELGA